MRSAFMKLSPSFLLVAMITIWAGCKTSELKLMPEPAKNIEGTWRIAKVLRNDEDLTGRVDTSRFQLVFQRDTTVAGGESGSYKIVNGAPFVVRDDGNWMLNDPAYPFYLSFTPSSGSQPVKVKFYFPDVQGQNQLSLIFSPGCTSNTYQYLLKKVDQ